MTARILQTSGSYAHDLIYRDYLSTLPQDDQETMRRSMYNSTRVWIGYDDDQVLGVWGLIPPTLLSDVAYLWLFTTHYLDRHVFTFVRHSQRAVAQMVQEYPRIVGHCVCDNAKAIRWLKWLGAEFDQPHDGIIPFYIEAESWHRQ